VLVMVALRLPLTVPVTLAMIVLLCEC
jgi:hypothetical protein